MLISIVVPSYSNASIMDLDLKQEILNLPAYYVIDDDEFNINFTNYQGINDISIEDSIKEVLSYQKNGAKILWNQEFVDIIIKDEFPDIYNMMIENNFLNVKYEVDNEKAFNRSYSSNEMSNLFEVTAYSLLGLRIYSLQCDMYWTWSGSRVTNAIPSSRIIIHDYTWHAAKIERSSGYFTSGDETYVHYVDGVISNVVGQTDHPFMKIILEPRIGYVADSYPR